MKKRVCKWDYSLKPARAYHEAGHAVMCYVLGVRVTSVMIVPRWGRKKKGGHVRHAPVKERTSLALIALAGSAAEGIFRKEPHRITERRNGVRRIRENADVLLAAQCFRRSPIWDAMIRATWNEAREICKWHWKKVRAAAMSLIKQNRLNESQFKALMEKTHS